MRTLCLLLLLAAAAHADPTDNAELGRLYEADFATMSAQAEGHQPVSKTPAEHCRRVRELVAADAVQTGPDAYHAAFLLQHGATSEDFMLAHSLAMVALEQGQPGASWVACSSLDQYLQSIGRPQVYGSHFHQPAGQPWTQDPIDSTVIPDPLRRKLRVPFTVEQQLHLRQLNSR